VTKSPATLTPPAWKTQPTGRDRRVARRRPRPSAVTRTPQTKHIDRWDARKFSSSSATTLARIWSRRPMRWLNRNGKLLEREPRYEVKTEPRTPRTNVKEAIVLAKEYRNPAPFSLQLPGVVGARHVRSSQAPGDQPVPCFGVGKELLELRGRNRRKHLAARGLVPGSHLGSVFVSSPLETVPLSDRFRGRPSCSLRRHLPSLRSRRISISAKRFCVSLRNTHAPQHVLHDFSSVGQVLQLRQVGCHRKCKIESVEFLSCDRLVSQASRASPPP